jgi:hypothetical protein
MNTNIGAHEEGERSPLMIGEDGSNESCVGGNMKILRVDMEKLQTSTEEVPEGNRIIGNRGMIAKIMLKEVPPTCHPLSRFNKLILATGPFAGTGVLQPDVCQLAQLRKPDLRTLVLVSFCEDSSFFSLGG